MLILDPRDPAIVEIIKMFDDHELKQQNRIKSVWKDIILNTSFNCQVQSASTKKNVNVGKEEEMNPTTLPIVVNNYFEHIFNILIFLILFSIVIINILIYIKLFHLGRKIKVQTGRRIVHSPFWHFENDDNDN